MTFNINRFSAEVNNSGLAIGGHFEVRVTRPRGLTLQGPFNNIVESVGLAARIDSIDLPGRTIATIDNYYDVGIRRDIPYGAIYPWPERKMAMKCDRCNYMEYPVCVDVCPTKALELVALDDFEPITRDKHHAVVNRLLSDKRKGLVILDLDKEL